MSRGISKRQRRILAILKDGGWMTAHQIARGLFPELREYEAAFEERSQAQILARALSDWDPPGRSYREASFSLWRSLKSLERRGLVVRNFHSRNPIYWGRSSWDKFRHPALPPLDEE